jgi:hypothetical protein
MSKMAGGKVCSMCGRHYKNLKDFGQFKLCKDCANKREKIKPSDTLDLEIQQSPLCLFLGCYSLQLGSVIIYGNNCKQDEIEDTIAHESMHFAIHVAEGAQACYQYDNIHDGVESEEEFLKRRGSILSSVVKHGRP